MKKLLGILTILTTLFFTAGAQEKPAAKLQNANNKHGLKQGRKDGKKMMKEMGLSKQQKMQMKEFAQMNKAKREAIQNDKTLSKQERRQKMMQLRKEQEEQMNTILTPEQRLKMKEKMQEKKSKYPQPQK